jgi:hypothetical protein
VFSFSFSPGSPLPTALVPLTLALSTPLGGHAMHSTSAESWSYAKGVCEAYSAWLVTIETAGENSHISNFLSSSSYYWIGLNDITTEGQWVWDHCGAAGATYTNWESSTQTVSYDCAMMNKSGKWYEKDCSDSSSLSFGTYYSYGICEIASTAPSSSPSVLPSCSPSTVPPSSDVVLCLSVRDAAVNESPTCLVQLIPSVVGV